MKTSHHPGLPERILQTLEQAVIVVDGQGGVRYGNQTARAWLGESDDVDGLFASARVYQDGHRWLDSIARTLAGEDLPNFICTIPSDAEEKLRVLAVTLRRLEHGATDQSPAVMIHLQDRSDLAGAEEQLAMNERLATLGKLASRVAHELNNPLDGILRYMNLSLRILAKQPQEQLQSYLEESRTGLMRMTQIVRELLAFSRSTHGQFDVTGINELIEQAIREYAPKAAEHKVVIASDFRVDQMPAVRGNRLYQVCSNLIKNAIEAMEDGGRLTITTTLRNNQVLIELADNGPGLPEPVERVFEAFFTTKEAGKGTGLGLAICRDLIEHLGGTITAKNAEDGGAVFTIRLPVERCRQVSDLAARTVQQAVDATT